jgi:hypothetical protein
MGFNSVFKGLSTETSLFLKWYHNCRTVHCGHKFSTYIMQRFSAQQKSMSNFMTQNLSEWCSWGFIQMIRNGKYHYLTYPQKAKMEVKRCPVHAMRVQRRSKGIAPLSLSLNARWRKVVNVTLWLHYPSWGEPSYTVKCWWGHTCCYNVFVDEKNLFWPAFELQLVCSQPSQYLAPYPSSSSEKTNIYSKNWASSSLTG